MLNVIIVSICLLVMSIEDIKSKSIPVWQLMIMAVLCTVVIIFQGNYKLQNLFAGMIPGILVVVLSASLGCFGMADGIILLIAGACLGPYTILKMVMFATFFMSVISLILIISKRISIKYEMPFVPFLFMGLIGVAV